MDKARQKTDRMLNDLERRVQAVYRSDPSLLRIQKRYMQYMDDVDKRTKDAYKAFSNEINSDTKAELKKAYMAQIEALTIKNKRYKDIVTEFARIMANVNQKALDLVNAEMSDIYVLNYNQIAVDCKKVGIDVNEN